MKPEMQKYNQAVEKLCAECAADVGKLISNCRGSVTSRMAKLAADIQKLQAPDSSSADLAKIPDLVEATLKKGGNRYASVATFGVRVNVTGNKVTVPASGISGPLAGIV